MITGKLGVMQAYFLPYLGYFQLIQAVDKFIVYGKVSFRKKSWITRNRILDAGTGLPITIQVPVMGKSSSKLIEHVGIDNNQNWQRKLVAVIFYNYKKSPYFKEIFPFLEDVISVPTDSLHVFNAFTISKICELLSIKTELVFEHPEFELLEKNLKSTELSNGVDVKTRRVFEICELHNFSNYINPPGGEELYSKDIFEANGYSIGFLLPELPVYSQFNFGYQSHLSIVDVLMHNGINKTSKMLNDYKIVYP